MIKRRYTYCEVADVAVIDTGYSPYKVAYYDV